jgi:hypothetical protein
MDLECQGENPLFYRWNSERIFFKLPSFLHRDHGKFMGTSRMKLDESNII